MNISRKIPLLLLLSISILFISCKKEVKKEPVKFSIEPQLVTVKWTGYKTTDKIGVNGQFKEIEISNTSEASTALEALNGVEFSIPISSLFTDEPTRDEKLKTMFFGIMENTLSLTGKLNLAGDGKGTIDLSMNGVHNQIPVTYIISGQLVELEGKMDINDWNAQAALASINEACFDLHKGPDGVSKTWSEVAVGAAIYLKKQ